MDIDKIISDYLSGELSEKDKKKLDSWLAENTDHNEQLNLLSKIWKSPVGYPKIVNIDDEQQKVWNKLKNDNGRSLQGNAKPTSLSSTTLKYAAVILLLMTVGYFIWNNQVSENKGSEAVVEMVERNNPLGQKSRIQLPDGSTVWLNSGSKISYSSDFDNKTRKLYLEGEAYFDVAKNPDIPFEVFTNDLVVTAIGTSFNVNAFTNKQIEKVALNTGKVKIECLDSLNNKCNPSFLDPGELALYDYNTGNISISDFNGLDPFGWKDGRIVFHHASFNEVIEVLSRWYNVDFEVVGKLNHKWDYSASFENEVLENILESLKYSENINYKMKGSKIEIML